MHADSVAVTSCPSGASGHRTSVTRRTAGAFAALRKFTQSGIETDLRLDDAPSCPPELLALFSKSEIAAEAEHGRSVTDTNLEQVVTDGLARYFAESPRPKADL